MQFLFYRANLAAGRTSLHIAVHDGLNAAIDEVAAAGAPERAFLSRSWFAAALPTDATGARTIVMRRDGGEVAVALPVAPGPFGIKAVPGSYWPFRSFAIAGDVTIGEFESFLAAPATKRALGAAWRVGPIYSDDPVLRLIEQAGPAAGWRLLKRRLGTSFQVDFATLGADGPWPSKSTLKNLRKLENRMAQLGSVEWLSLSGADLDTPVLDQLAALEAKSWQGVSRDAKFHAASHRQVWERLIADPAQAGRFRVQLLKIDGQLAAWRFHLEPGALIYGIAGSYDPAFAKYSPGLYSATRSLIDARDRGFERFDRGSGDSGAKQQLGASPGPDIVDCLLVRGPLARIAGAALERVWRRHESPSPSVTTTEDAAPDGVD